MFRARYIVFGVAFMLLMASCGGSDVATSESSQGYDEAAADYGVSEEDELPMGDALRAERVVISKQSMALKLYDSDNRLRCRFSVAVGRGYGNKSQSGDMCTPEVEFAIEQIQPASHWVQDFGKGQGLVEGYYGNWFVRLDTPHEGIGIHGTNDPSSIGGRTTEGCVRLANGDLDSLRPMLREGMRVAIVPSISDRRANGEVVDERSEARAVITDRGGAAERVEQTKSEVVATESGVPSVESRPAKQQGGEVWHTVVDGELVGRIARSYGVTIAEIERLNPGINVDRISIGQRILISNGTVAPQSERVEKPQPENKAQEVVEADGQVWYTVVDGDLVGKIAIKYGTTSKRIAELNPDINIDKISIGQRIRVK